MWKDLGKACVIALGIWLVLLTIGVMLGDVRCGPASEVGGILEYRRCTLTIPLPFH